LISRAAAKPPPLATLRAYRSAFQAAGITPSPAPIMPLV
jgi:hypothetical protein